MRAGRRGPTRHLAICLFVVVVAGGCVSPVETTAGLRQARIQLVAEGSSSPRMVVLGNGPIYLYHSSEAGSKDGGYQFVLEAELLKKNIDAAATYATDRRLTDEAVYTLIPESIALPELFAASGGLPQRRTFRGTLFRGRPEHGGARLMDELTIEIKRVVFAKRFDATEEKQSATRYVVFGNNRQLFAAHVKQGPEDFEHLADIRVASGILTESQAEFLRNGALVDLNAPRGPLGYGQTRHQPIAGAIDFGQGMQHLSVVMLRSY